MARGGSAHQRRNTRRAAERRTGRGVQKALARATGAQITDEQADDLTQLVAAATGSTASDEAAEAVLGQLGGKPSKGTKPDRRLKENAEAEADAEASAGDRALEAIEVAERGENVALTLTAAVGDVAWGPEEGFVDLLCDVNEALGAGAQMGGDAGYPDEGYPYCPVRAIDASVKLDKVLVAVGDDYFVAPITIDGDGEPVLGDRDEWVPVEEGFVEVRAEGDDAMTAAGRMRAHLTEFAFATETLPDELQPREVVPPRGATVPEPESQLRSGSVLEWEAVFVPEATLTDDGRAFAPGALTWRELPLTLMAMVETSEGGHVGAEVCGRIDRMWRDGNLIRAAGVFDAGEYGQEIARMVAEKILRGLSVDIAIHQYETGPRSDWFDEDGNWREDVPERQEPADEPSLLDRLFGQADEDSVFVVTDAVIGMATVCPFPAFAGAHIALVASGGGAVWRYEQQAMFVVVEREAPAALTAGAVVADAPVEERPRSLTAAAAGLAPLKPPAEWFDDPELDELTPLTITDEGRIYGHAWAWETCHLSFDTCVTPPHSRTANAYYHLGEIECEDGELVAVGKVTIDAPHAGARLTRVEAVRHYDHTGTVAAHVRSGEDSFGGWFAGAVSPDLSEETLRVLRGSTLSGDWRGVDGNLELVALLAVNVPGYPVPRSRALVAACQECDDEEEVLALTAAGVVADAETAAKIAEIRQLAADSLRPAVAPSPVEG